MKTIKIFLASSEELKEERLQLADLVENLNHTLAKQDLHIQLVKWEYLDSSMGPKHKQEEYNEELRTCELCLVLYWTKFGMYTKKELDTAYHELCAGNNPKKLYVYFKDGSEITPDLKSFRDSFPDQYGHFFCHFENIDTLKADFLLQFMDYQSKALKDSKFMEVKEGKVTIDGKEYVDLQNVPFAGNNEEYNILQKLIKKNKKLLAVTEPDDPEYAEYASELLEQQEKLKKIESSLWDTALMITRLSTTKCSERLQRAMDLFNQGDNKGAQAILNEEEIEKDVQHNLNLMKLGEEGKKGLKTNIDEYLLKIRTYENEMEEGWLQKRCELCNRVLQLTISLYGENAEETANAYHNLGYVYSDIGDYTQALEYNQKALKIREKVLGIENSNTAKSYNNIGLVYWDLGDYPQALEYHQKALEIREKILGDENSDTAGSYGNIGIVYYDLGNYPQAIEYYQKAIGLYEKVLGTEHHETASSYGNIGLAYEALGNFPQALEYYQKALTIREKVLGKKHPDTATSYSYIGGVYEELGDYPQALEYYQKALTIREKVLGKKHPDTARSYDNTGRVYWYMGDYPQAMAFLQKALEIREKVLGVMHPDTAISYNNIGSIYHHRGDYSQAQEYYQKALRIRENVLGAEHPDTAMSYNNIGNVYSDRGDYPQALKYHQKALEIYEKVFGAEHPYAAMSYNNIGTVYSDLGDYPQAQEYYQKALRIRENVLGAEHPKTVRTYRELGHLYLNIGDDRLASQWFVKAAALGDTNAQLNIGYMYDMGKGVEQDFSKAIKWYMRAVKQGYKYSYNGLAWTYCLMGKYDDALPWAEKAVAAFPDNPDHIDTLATVFQGLGRYNEAMAQFELCLKLYNEQKNPEGVQRTEEKITSLKELMKNG